VAVVGAGAAGLMVSIWAARRCPGRTVVALDGAQRLGAKILVAGGGRCNVTNAEVRAEDYCGGSRRVVRRVLGAWPVPETVAFFETLRVSLHAEEGGKLFPNTHRARTVLDALLGAARAAGAQLVTGCRVTALDRTPEGFVLTTSGGPVRARTVVLATGGLALPRSGSDGTGYRLAEALGHTLVPPSPALVPLVLDGEFHRPLAGVSHPVELTVRAEGDHPLRLAGSLLWTHFGVSGPVVLNASRHWLRARLAGRAVTMMANLLPGERFETAEAAWQARTSAQPRQSLQGALADRLPARVAEAVLAELRIDARVPLAHLSRDVRRRLLNALLAWPMPVRDSRGYNYAEVTAGGIPLEEIDPATMQSRLCPGLFLVGEILDVDGRIGGFNFQWAWSSGYLAAAGLAAALA